MGTTAFGTNAWVGFGEEATYGTGVAASKYFRILSEDMKLEQSKQFVQFLGSALSRRTFSSKRSVSGGVKLAVPYGGFGILLKHALGNVATTGSDVPYTHTITAAALPIGLTVEANRDAAAVGTGSSFQYAGCQIKALKLSQGLEGFLEADVTLVGADESNINVSSATFPAEVYVDWTQVTAFTVNGATIPGKMIELSIENDLAEDRFKLGQRTRFGMKRKGGKVSGKFSLEFSSLTQLALFQNLTNAPVVAKWESGTNSLQMTLATAYLNSGTPNAKDSGPIIMEMGYEGDLADLTVVLANVDASY